jgi:cell division transport system permease protein
MIVGFIRAITYAVQHIWRNLWLSIITLFLLTLTMLSMTLVYGLNVVGQQMITAIQEKVDVDFYFYDYVPEQDLLKAQEYVRGLEETRAVQYTSSEAALQEFTEEHKDDPAILASISELEKNVLPGRLTVKANSLAEYPQIIEAVQQSEFQEYIDTTDYSDNSLLIDRIQNVTDIAKQGALIVTGIFLVIAIIVIFNTFRITIYSYREEIGIMKLVGATNSFIRAPFLIEGVLLGTCAAIITIVVSVIVLQLSDAPVRSFFSGYSFSLLAYTQAHLWWFILAEWAIATIFSVAFTMVAISRYLRV